MTGTVVKIIPSHGGHLGYHSNQFGHCHFVSPGNIGELLGRKARLSASPQRHLAGTFNHI
jgi:hypothetical protein